MSLQWTLIAGFMYAEVLIVLLLLFPFISAKRWQQLFKSRFLQVLKSQATIYFVVVLIILAIFLMDSIREMMKYHNVPKTEHNHLETELQNQMRLFRAQRNMYICGFALFLSLVIRRLTMLISRHATVMAEHEAALKQAKSATATAKQLMNKSGEGDEALTKSHKEEIQKVHDEFQKTIDDLTNKVNKQEKDKDALLSQSKSLEKEYDRLMEEFRKVELKLKVQGDKKEE